MSFYKYLLAYGKIGTNVFQSLKTLGLSKQSLYEMLLLDAIVGNVDRHLNNFDLFITEDSIKLAPISDLGAAVLHMYLTMN